ncbi:MAG: PHP domain-containing protein [Bacteroidetes bacterium]|nr:PHP domain-containing protein [Bacteroidota bacterium]
MDLNVQLEKKSPPNNSQADLHIHTTYSDGVLSPREILEKSVDAGLSAIAITDHDHIGALSEACELSTHYGVEVITGVEFSVSVNGRENHILGYYIDPDNARLTKALTFFREQRLKRAEKMISKLHTLQIPLSMDSVLHYAKHGAVGRPHIAQALVDGGYVETYYEAFTRYIGADCPAYESKYTLSPQEAIELIADAGGLSFLAHPGKSARNGDILELIKLGLDGIETIHPKHSESQILYYRSLIVNHYLLECGGSDYHGVTPIEESHFGSFTVPYDLISEMKQRLFQKR